MRIEDDGEFIPYAAKHMRGGANGDAEANDESPAHDGGNADVCLKKLWPEPDWEELIQRGKSEEAVGWLAMLYSNLKKAPRDGRRSRVSGDDWRDAYCEAIEHIKALFDQTKTLDDAKDIAERLAVRLGKTTKQIVKERIETNIVYWAAGQGTSRVYPISYLPMQKALIAPLLTKFGWPQDSLVLKTKLVPCHTTDGNWYVGECRGKSVYFASEALASEEDAIAYLQAKLQSIRDEKNKTNPRSGGDPKPSRPIVAKKQAISVHDAVDRRVGPEWRTGDVTTSALLDEFALRGVQFGASISDSERQVWLNGAFDALADLADVLRWPRKWVGFGGELALALGARGKGRAAAHYEPQLRVINLTRTSGVSALAHEWAHGMDYRMGRTLFKNSDGMAAACLWTLGSNYQHRGVSSFNDNRLNLLAEMVVSMVGAKRGGVSQYVRDGASLEPGKQPLSNKAYWTKPTELLARAFEAYVEETLSMQGRASPMLVSGTQDSSLAKQYPQGIERSRLLDTFERGLGSLRAKE